MHPDDPPSLTANRAILQLLIAEVENHPEYQFAEILDRLGISGDCGEVFDCDSIDLLAYITTRKQ